MTATASQVLDAQAVMARLEGRLFATTTEAAAVLHYDHRTVRKAIEAGEIPATKAGATWRIPVAWLREQAQLETSAAGS